jgi:two-component system, OmpR family, sensor histidine kinase KdpD
LSQLSIPPFFVVLRVAGSVGIVAVVTALGSRVIPVNATTAGFAYLIAVLALAAAWGRLEAIVASVVAMLCFNFYFLPPVGQFTIADPQNWVALFSFLATALVASHLSDRAKRQALDARNRQQETEQLYALSRAILLTEASESVGSQAAQQIAQIFECPAVTLYDAKSGEFYKGGPGDLPDIESKLKQVVIQGTVMQIGPDVFVAPVVLGGNPIGSLALRGPPLSDGAMQALCNLVAISLERVHTRELSSRAEVARQSEEFKSTLLDAIAHEFKTPLTSIKAAATSILADSHEVPASVRELTTIIDEETDRLSLLVTEAVRMSRIDAGKVRIERAPIAARELLEGVLEHFASRVEGRAVRIEVEEGIPPLWADQELVSLALRQLVDNALKYSPPASPLEVTAGVQDERVAIHVRDHGPGIPERERDRIFDKFYRRPVAKNQVPGTGLGLYIAREIIRAHGGDVWVEGTPGGGADFSVAVPVQEAFRKG